MLLKNATLDRIIAGEISVVFRVWKRPTVKAGGTLNTRKGVLAIKNVEQIDRGQVTDEDIRNAGLGSRDDLCEIDRKGDFYRITVKYVGEDPRVAMRQNLDAVELASIREKVLAMGDWATEYLREIGRRPNIHAQVLADDFGLEKLKFKARVRRLKALGLTESLRPGYKLSLRGEALVKIL
ncbi:MAG TPA: hypothetical protein PKO33_09520 [Pyrinomonadaceae bacterium]|nr:hypothetical protein [Pyrinomonadaceae bacterium]